MSGFQESVLLIGEKARPEFAPIAVSCCSLISGVPHLTAETHSGLEPLFHSLSKEKQLPAVRFIVLFESRPGEFSPDSVRKLRFRFPLTPILLLAGPLCEGEGRTGNLPAGAVRICTYEWDGLGEREFSRFLKTGRGLFALPLTANTEDFFRIRDNRSDSPSRSKAEERPLCCIVSPDPGMRELLTSVEKKNYIVCEKRFCSEILRDPSAALWERIVIDSFEKDGKDLLPLLKELEETCPGASFDVLLFSPRPDEIQILTASIRDLRVIPKPFDISRLNSGHR